MAVKKYSLSKDGKKQLSDHFQVYEFASNNGAKVYSDVVLIDTALISMLEKVYKHFKCSKIIISSGYRTATHDRDVGGSGSGYHVKGQAADFCCYDKNGKQIPSSKVCLYLEDIKCYGIGYNCGGSTVYTHADTRTAAVKWWGDESKNYASITAINGSTSFYTYLGVKKETTSTSKTATKKVKLSMDISDDGVNFIKSQEGLSLTACKALPTEEYLTIGYGHYGAEVKPNQTITEAEAVALLKSDLKMFVSTVNAAVTVKITQKQFDACVSLAYNIGCRGFSSSDLVKELNSGNKIKAAAEFPLWRTSGGNVIAGLENRRERELKMFIAGNTYTLTDEMNVRSKASTRGTVKTTLAAGTKVKVKDVSVDFTPSASNISIWCKINKGWVCFKQGANFFAK